MIGLCLYYWVFLYFFHIFRIWLAQYDNKTTTTTTITTTTNDFCNFWMMMITVFGHKKKGSLFFVVVTGKSIFPLNQWRKWKQNLNLIGPGHKTVMMTKVAHWTSNIMNNHQEFNIDTVYSRVFTDERKTSTTTTMKVFSSSFLLWRTIISDWWLFYGSIFFFQLYFLSHFGYHHFWSLLPQSEEEKKGSKSNQIKYIKKCERVCVFE